MSSHRLLLNRQTVFSPQEDKRPRTAHLETVTRAHAGPMLTMPLSTCPRRLYHRSRYYRFNCARSRTAPRSADVVSAAYACSAWDT